jgi:hypothetical protein
MTLILQTSLILNPTPVLTECHRANPGNISANYSVYWERLCDFAWIDNKGAILLYGEGIQQQGIPPHL